MIHTPHHTKIVIPISGHSCPCFVRGKLQQACPVLDTGNPGFIDKSFHKGQSNLGYPVQLISISMPFSISLSVFLW
jgi:hypothetical protein